MRSVCSTTEFNALQYTFRDEHWLLSTFFCPATNPHRHRQKLYVFTQNCKSLQFHQREHTQLRSFASLAEFTVSYVVKKLMTMVNLQTPSHAVTRSRSATMAASIDHPSCYHELLTVALSEIFVETHEREYDDFVDEHIDFILLQNPLIVFNAIAHSFAVLRAMDDSDLEQAVHDEMSKVLNALVFLPLCDALLELKHVEAFKTVVAHRFFGGFGFKLDGKSDIDQERILAKAISLDIVMVTSPL